MSNRRLKYGESTKLVSGFRVPESKVEIFREQVYRILDKWLVSQRKLGNEIIPSEKTILINALEKADFTGNETTGYEYAEKIPMGSVMINIIGYNIHKHYSDEIYYCKLPDGKSNKIVQLYSEKEVKAFIRKELIK